MLAERTGLEPATPDVTGRGMKPTPAYILARIIFQSSANIYKFCGARANSIPKFFSPTPADNRQKAQMKYIVMALADKEEIFVFPRSVDHDRMAEACEMIRFGSDRNWNRKYRDGECVSAGFIDNGVCHGRSESLDLSSRPELDTMLLRAIK